MGGISPRETASGGAAFPYFVAFMVVGPLANSLVPWNGNWGTIPAEFQTGWTSERSSTGTFQLGLPAAFVAALFNWQFFVQAVQPAGSAADWTVVDSTENATVAGYDNSLQTYNAGVLANGLDPVLWFVGTS